MPFSYLLCTLPHFPFSAYFAFPPPPLVPTSLSILARWKQHQNICMRNLLRNFMTREKGNEKRKRNFWYLLFCCLFLLFHFLIIGFRRTRAERETEIRTKARETAHFLSLSLMAAPKYRTVAGRASCPRTSEQKFLLVVSSLAPDLANIMIINYGVWVM